jgi:hypothetical protein
MNVTKRTMNILTLGVLALVMLAGCDNPENNQTSKTPDPKDAAVIEATTETGTDAATQEEIEIEDPDMLGIRFELPDTWGVDFINRKARTSYVDQNSGESVGVLLHWGAYTDKGMTDENAERWAWSHVDKDCTPPENVVKKEMGGRNVYFVRNLGCSIYTGFSPDGTNFYFIHNGYVVSFAMAGDYLYVEDDIKRLIETFTMSYDG